MIASVSIKAVFFEQKIPLALHIAYLITKPYCIFDNQKGLQGIGTLTGWSGWWFFFLDGTGGVFLYPLSGREGY